MKFEFAQKKAVVIGGSGGIGKNISEKLLEADVSVCSIGRHVVPGTDSLIIDLDDRQNRDIVITSVQEADILCIVRGPFLQKSVELTDSEEWEYMTYANLAFPGMLISAALPRMNKNHWGRILVLGGTRTDTVRGFRTNAAYAAAKTGLSSLVKSVAAEYADRGITCNGISPGFVETEYISEKQKAELAAKNPDGRLISVSDVAETAIFLLKMAAINGVILTVDKGWRPLLI